MGVQWDSTSAVYRLEGNMVQLGYIDTFHESKSQLDTIGCGISYKVETYR
jgi:hypothetical protein